MLLDEQAGTVFDAAPVGAAAIVDAVAQKLFDQIGISSVDLDTIEAGVESILGGARIVGNQSRQFIVTQGARCGHRHEAFARKGHGI